MQASNDAALLQQAHQQPHNAQFDSSSSSVATCVQAFDQAALVRQAHNLGAMGGKPQLVTNFPPMIYLVRIRPFYLCFALVPCV